LVEVLLLADYDVNLNIGKNITTLA